MVEYNYIDLCKESRCEQLSIKKNNFEIPAVACTVYVLMPAVACTVYVLIPAVACTVYVLMPAVACTVYVLMPAVACTVYVLMHIRNTRIMEQFDRVPACSL